MLSWIFIVLDHWNNSLRVDMSLNSDTLSWFLANQSLLLFYKAVCLWKNSKYIVFGLTRLELEPTIHCIWGEHTNQYTADVEFGICKFNRHKFTKEDNSFNLSFGIRKFILVLDASNNPVFNLLFVV